MQRLKLLIFLIGITVSIYPQDFNPGPYGTYPFDIAGPFSIHDMNNDIIVGL